MPASEAGTMNLIIGLATMVLSIPLILRLIPMNYAYGIRLWILKVWDSEENWYEINAYGGKWFFAAGAVIAAVGGLVLKIDVHEEWVLKVLSLSPLLFLVAIIPVVIYSRKL